LRTPDLLHRSHRLFTTHVGTTIRHWYKRNGGMTCCSFRRIVSNERIDFGPFFTNTRTHGYDSPFRPRCYGGLLAHRFPCLIPPSHLPESIEADCAPDHIMHVRKRICQASRARNNSEIVSVADFGEAGSVLDRICFSLLILLLNRQMNHHQTA